VRSREKKLSPGIVTDLALFLTIDSLGEERNDDETKEPPLPLGDCDDCE
jgi:hypothetical protein